MPVQSESLRAERELESEHPEAHQPQRRRDADDLRHTELEFLKQDEAEDADGDARHVIMMFVIMMWRILNSAMTSPDLFSGLICTGVMIHIAAQVVINIAVVTNSMPSTGIPLPFISYGGTSVMILMAEMGMVLGISTKCKST